MRAKQIAVALCLVAAACGTTGGNEAEIAELEAQLADAEAALADAEAALADADVEVGEPSDELGETTTEASSGFHVAALEPASTRRGNTWRAEVTVVARDATGEPVPDVTVDGAWEAGDIEEASCATGADGTCVLKSGYIRVNVNWNGLELVLLEHPELSLLEGEDYNPAGLTIDVRK